GSVSSSPRAYFQSMRARTASAAWRSERPSTYGARRPELAVQARRRAVRARGTVRRTGRHGTGTRADRRCEGRGSPWETRRGPPAGSFRGPRRGLESQGTWEPPWPQAGPMPSAVPLARYALITPREIGRQNSRPVSMLGLGQ